MTLLSYLQGKKESTFLSELRPAETTSLALTTPPRWFPQDQHCRTLLSFAAIPTRASCWLKVARSVKEQQRHVTSGEDAPPEKLLQRLRGPDLPAQTQWTVTHFKQWLSAGISCQNREVGAGCFSSVFLCQEEPCGVSHLKVSSRGGCISIITLFFFTLFPTASV